MKILVLAPIYPVKNALNHGVFIHQQVKALQELGAECHVLLLHNWFPPLGLHRFHPGWIQGFNYYKAIFREFEGVEIHPVSVSKRKPDRIFKDDYCDRAAAAIAGYVKGHRALQHADWLYAHFLTDCGFIGTKVKKLLNIKLAAIARGGDIHNWPEENPQFVNNLKAVFKNADIVLANSGRLAADARRWMDSDNIRRVEVVYNGINYDRFYPAENAEEKKLLLIKHGLDPNKKHLICIATPVQLKGWIELLHSIQALGNRFNGWELLMVAPHRPNSDALDLVAMGKELGIENKIRPLGKVEPDKLVEILRASDAFALASYNEGMANALLEAMASGLACVATDVGGHAEVIDDKVNGHLVPHRSVSELTQALAQVITNPTHREMLGRNAREAILKFGNYKENSKKLIDLFSRY